jgi:hypothetical protein
MEWWWRGLPDPRPQPGFARGLGSPSGHTAAGADLSVAHLLAAQLQAVTGRSAWPRCGEHQEPTPARRQERPLRHAPQAAVAAPPAARPEGNQDRARSQRTGGQDAAGDSAGDLPHTQALPAHWVLVGSRAVQGPTFRWMLCLTLSLS